MYKNFQYQDEFSDRLTYFLLHFAFFLKVLKKNDNKIVLQEIYDFIFRQLELSIREIGYGDQTINKKMKDYINIFYSMIDAIYDWDQSTTKQKDLILKNYINNSTFQPDLVNYFDDYRKKLSNNTLNYYLKSVLKT